MREAPEPEIDLEKLKEYEDQIEIEDVTPHDFGRIAAQTAKQVILQRIREAERDMMFEEYRDRVGELITGIVQQSDSRYTLVQLRERVEALLPKSEQVDGERYDHSQRIKAVIKDVSNSTKGPSIIVSRRDPELIKSLFELEVPEIADGLVEITGVAREPGYRSKIAVVSHVDGVDPVGACVGPRGSRVRMVVSELRGEKIDIIPYNDEPARFVAKALSPARVREVLVDDAGKQATVIVPDDQLSLAIGREGQNARLAARLTGWRIDIRSETEFAAEEAEHGYERGGRSAGPLRRDPVERPPLPERRAAGLTLLRHRGPPGAGEQGHRSGRGADEQSAPAEADEAPADRLTRRTPRRCRSAHRAANGAAATGRRRSAAAEDAGSVGDVDCTRRMNKRVHEIAKERGLPAKDVLARLKAAGIEVKAASSIVDEDGRAARARQRRRTPAAGRRQGEAAPAPKAGATARRPALSPAGRRRQRPAHGAAPPSAPSRPRRQPAQARRPQPGRVHQRPPRPERRAQRRAEQRTSVRRATRCRASAPPATPAGGAAS